MKKVLKNFAIFAIHLFCLFAIIELSVNYLSFYYLFPIKNATSYGYILKKGTKTIIPLNKYSSRLKAQIALPYELVRVSFDSNKVLVKSYDKITNKYGFVDSNNKLVIDYKYDKVEEFENDFAVVAMNIKNQLKFGTIDKKGRWIVEPKYEHLCPFSKYYTKACIDKDHCGVIDRYGNEITLMSYRTDKIDSANGYGLKLCKIGEKNEIHCNYFL